MEPTYVIQLHRLANGSWRADIVRRADGEVVGDVADASGEECLHRARLQRDWYVKADRETAPDEFIGSLEAVACADDEIPF